ncbi:MAG: PD40 domain-containing protein, partial [Bacteroidaceae bacterium]|nr:PD40 domain-containing protein [Bacteroidaceae bacterium]
MNIRQMLAATAFVLPFADGAAQNAGETNSFIGKTTVVPAEDVLTPEALWAMGRIGSFAVSPDGKNAVYSVTYYSVKQNKSHSVIYAMDMATRASRMLTSSVKSEMSPTFIKNGEKVAYLSSESGSSQLWEMNMDGSERRQLSFEADDVLDYLF